MVALQRRQLSPSNRPTGMKPAYGPVMDRNVSRTAKGHSGYSPAFRLMR
jgi:hypothetical protein